VKAGTARRQHSRPGQEEAIRKVFNLKWQVFEAGFNIREIRKDNRGDEPGEAGKGRPQLVNQPQ
jgi:hypothetical protein